MIPTIIAIIVIVLAVGGAIFYVVRAKRKGQKCIGCPYANSCSKKENKPCDNKN